MIREILPIRYAESVLPESWVFRGGAQDRFLPIVFQLYLIRTEDRMILADAGCETMPGFAMKNFIGPIRALAERHIAPEAITDVIITHAHHDHIECVNRFTHADIYIQREEYEIGKPYFSESNTVICFDEEIEVCDGVKVIRSGGHSIGSCVIELSAGARKYVIVGDECYKRRCLEEKTLSGKAYDPQKNLAFLEKYGTGAYTVLLSHDE